MKQFQHTMLLASLATLLLLAAGCTREEIGNKEGSGGSGTTTGQAVSVTLPVLLADPEPIAEGMTAPRTAPATRTLTSALTNVWVLQFDSSGKNVSTTNTGTLAAGAHLAPTLVSGKNCTLYVVANGPASGLSTSNPASLTDFETKLLYTTKVTDATQIPLAGKLVDVEVVDIGGGTGQLKLMDATTEIVLKRILAEVTLTVDIDSRDYYLRGVTLYNVPVGAAYGWNSNNETFPDSVVVANFGYTSTAVSGLFAASTTTAGTKTTYKWFVGENRQGRSYYIVYPTERNTNYITNTQYNSIHYATYARIEIGATNAAPPYTIQEKIYYEIYLGSGSVIDFNLERNHTYTLSTTIKGSATYQELLIDTDGRVSGINLPICLTDKRADSPFAIMQKEWEGKEIWTNKGSSVTGATDPFDGKKNTDILSPPSHMAARECRANGEEWDLPAQAELALIWIYLPAIPEADRPADRLWSSTESDSGNSWAVDYTNGGIFPYEKYDALGHRCIKSR